VRSGGREFQGRNRREDRSFFFPDVAPGRYALGVARGSRGRVVVVEEVDVGTGLVEHDLRVPSPDPSEFISVSVLGPDGEPLKGVQISTGYKSKGSSSSGGSTVVRRPDGTLWVFHHEHQFSEDPEGTYWITLTAKNHGNVTLEYRKGERSEWTVRMEEPGRVEARVTGIEKSPVADRLSFQLLAPSADGRVFRDTRSERVDAAGLQVLSSVQPGEYALVLLVAHSHVSMPVARVPVTVRGGRNEFTVPLPPLHQVVVTGAEGTATLQTPEGVRFVIWSQSTDGRAVFEGIPEGEYTVNAGSKSKSFRVSGPTKVEL
jgi:hypothetical protein